MPLYAGDHDPPSPPAVDLANLDIEQLMQVKVQAASLHEQSLEDAPASVTIITQDEIRRYGWRTLGEALSSARGLYTGYDHSYRFLGVRGFSLPGDYGTRLLVMVNGHNMIDNVFGENAWFGQDFPLDMTLVKRIEIIRGPSSALYGSNGIFIMINLVTISPEEFNAAEVRTEVGSFGEKKLQAASSIPLGHGATLLLSGALFNNSGEHSIYIPQFNFSATNYGRAIDMDGEKGYHLFANLTWGGWSVVALLGAREKIQPISWGETVFNDRGTRGLDSRNFIDATYTHSFDSSRSLQWRVYYDSFRFRGIFRYPDGDGIEDNRSFYYGDWVGSQLSYRFPVPRVGTLTVGAEGRLDLRALQKDIDAQPQYKQFLSVDKRDKSFAIFVQDEWDLTRTWKLDLGVRLDRSAYREGFVSPRAALIYQPSARTSYKFLYGRAFRNPSAYELFYDDGGLTAVANPAARPEKADTFEFSIERKLTRQINALVSAYQYRIKDMLVVKYVPSGAYQFQNEGKDRASGVEIEFNGHLIRRLEFVTSWAMQRAVESIWDRGRRWQALHCRRSFLPTSR